MSRTPKHVDPQVLARAGSGRRGGVRGVLVALLVAAAVAWPAVLEAQQRAPQLRRGQDREQLEQRIRAQMGRMMQERLGLDEAQAASLAEVVQDFDVRRRELFALEQATRRRVEALLLEGNGDEAEATELMERMVELRLREAELFREEQGALLDVLTPTQVLRLQALRQELGQRIRALRGGPGGGDERARRPGGPGRGAFRDGPGDAARGPAALPWRGVLAGPTRIL
jgi:Spy/CpxP family protein refolding chaperone